MLEVAGDLRRAPAKFENPVGFDPYFGETILILAFFSLCILNLSIQEGRKESGDLPKNNFIQFQSPSGYLILEFILYILRFSRQKSMK